MAENDLQGSSYAVVRYTPDPVRDAWLYTGVFTLDPPGPLRDLVQQAERKIQAGTAGAS